METRDDVEVSKEEDEITGKSSTDLTSYSGTWFDEAEEMDELEEELEEEGEAEEEAEDENYLEEEWSTEEGLTPESSITEEDEKQQTEESSSLEDSDYAINQKSLLSVYSRSCWDSAEEFGEESPPTSEPPAMKEVIVFRPSDLIFNRNRLRKPVYLEKLSDPVPQELLYLAGCIGYRQEETDKKKWIKKSKIEQVLFGSKDRGERIRNIMRERNDVRWKF